MKKLVNVLMLSNKDGLIYLGNEDKDLGLSSTGSYSEFHYNKQHLYFTSSEEIKVGDWSIVTYLDTNKQEAVYNTAGGIIAEKVIATTDKSLGLPLIPQSFIEEYVKSSGEIKEVELLPDYMNGILILESSVYHPTTIPITKKQTVEEAAEESAGGLVGNERYEHIQGFISGAKWRESNS